MARRRHKVSFFPSFLSITLVLFLGGLFALFLLHAQAIKRQLKSEVEMRVEIKPDVKEADVQLLRRKLEGQPEVTRARYVSKEEGLKRWKEDVGEDLHDLLGENPLPDMLEVRFEPDFVSLDSFEMVKKELMAQAQVRDVVYDRDIVRNIDRNIRVVGIVLVTLAVIMGVVSVILIHNTIRMTLYARRFTIKSMQLVGATRAFIRWPFVLRAMMTGLMSGLVAVLLLAALLYWLNVSFPYQELQQLQDFLHISIVFFGLIALGIMVTGMSSWVAVNRYLRLRLDDLF